VNNKGCDRIVVTLEVSNKVSNGNTANGAKGAWGTTLGLVEGRKHKKSRERSSIFESG